MSLARLIALSFGIVVAHATIAAAQFSVMPETEGTPSQIVPGLDRIGVDEHLEAPMPRDLAFRDHEGRPVRLGDFLDGRRPVLLNFAYHTCPTLCSMVLDATVNGMKGIPWSAGEEFEVVTISIDPRDTPERAAAKRRELLAKYGRPSAARGWHFLVGDQDAIDAATRAAGIRYFYDAQGEQYAHPATLLFLTPAGRIARYLYGIQFNPSDVRLALLEASEGRSISTAEQLIMYCYHYDASERGYALVAMNVMKLGGLLTLLIFGGFLALMWRREARRSDHGSAPRAGLDAQTNQVGLS